MTLVRSSSQIISKFIYFSVSIDLNIGNTYYHIISFIYRRKMVNMTYQDLFFTTKKGLPNITALPSTITMSSNVFVYSLILQIIVFIFLIFHFGWAIYRVIKKMKNNRFQDVPN